MLTEGKTRGNVKPDVETCKPIKAPKGPKRVCKGKCSKKDCCCNR